MGQHTNTDGSSDGDLSLTDAVKRYIRAAYDYECALCGADGTQDDVTLHVHHRVLKKDGGTNHPGNLIVLCSDCHNRHHGAAVPVDSPQTQTDQSHETTTEHQAMQPSNSRQNDNDPLPPHSSPNGTDQEIIGCIEEHGPMSAVEVADHIDITSVYARRELWKLAGEGTIVRRSDNQWDIPERTPDTVREVGIPDNPSDARRAGRDEVIRRMSVQGMSHEQISQMVNLSRSTVDEAVFRARARRATDLAISEDPDISAVTDQLSLALEWLGQIDQQGDTSAD